MRDWDLEFSLLALEDDARAFPDDRIEAPQPAPVMHGRRGTYEERRQWFIDEGCCPRPGCHVPLDDGACPQCGWTLADERNVGWTPEQEPDYTATLPLALTLEEYAPAAVEDEAA